MTTIESLAIGDRFVHPVSGEVIEILKKDKEPEPFTTGVFGCPIYTYWIEWQSEGVNRRDYFYDFRLVEQA